jgi:hypothetical protein
MANKHMKKCLPSFAIKDMQIKTTLRFHLTTARMAISSRTQAKTNTGMDSRGGGPIGTLRHVGGNEM